MSFLSSRSLPRAVAALAAAAFGGVVAAIAVASVRKTSTNLAATAVKESMASRGLESDLHFLVELPEGYSASGRRYPVVYFLHGLPATTSSYLQLGWVERALEQTSRQAILVVPQGTLSSGSDPEYHDWGAGNDWETALAVELPAWIDAHYRTIASRSGRAIVGVSAGGYGAAIIGLHHPNEYAAIESWSGYFRPTDPTGVNTLDVGSDSDNAYASVQSLVPSLKRQFARYPTYFAFYVGSADPTFVTDNTALDRALSSAGVWHVFRAYPGGHSTAVWLAHATAWLGQALDHLQAPVAA
jgi:S-formylglutathione hydrolase FrmB